MGMEEINPILSMVKTWSFWKNNPLATAARTAQIT